MAVVGLVMAWAGMAHACEGPMRPAFWYDEPITIAADGSFTNGGDSYGYDLVGRPVVDMGDADFEIFMDAKYLIRWIKSKEDIVV